MIQGKELPIDLKLFIKQNKMKKNRKQKELKY